MGGHDPSAKEARPCQHNVDQEGTWWWYGRNPRPRGGARVPAGARIRSDGVSKWYQGVPDSPSQGINDIALRARPRRAGHRAAPTTSINAPHRAASNAPRSAAGASNVHQRRKEPASPVYEALLRVFLRRNSAPVSTS